MPFNKKPLFVAVPLVAIPLVTLIAGCAKVDPLPAEDLNVLPAFVKGAVRQAAYDGTTNDLLTGGLGQTGLLGVAPAFVDANNPTAAVKSISAR